MHCALSHRLPPFGAGPCTSPLPPCSLGSALGTIAYTAPETFTNNCVKKPSDVYAFGIMREHRPHAQLPTSHHLQLTTCLTCRCCRVAAAACPLQLLVGQPGAPLPASACLPAWLAAVWEMFYCRDPYEGLMDGQICVGVSGVWLCRSVRVAAMEGALER
jgi:serine/threonine protein kinase